MYEILECGIHERRQYAQRADGVWFARYQYRGRHGHKWTPWKVYPFGQPPENARRDPFGYRGKARLPK